MFTKTTATEKLSLLDKRIRGVAGGTSASKTISILLLLIDYAQSHENKTISVVSATYPHLKRGAIKDFLNIMKAHEYFHPACWNKTDSTYEFPTGSKMEFFGMDDSGKSRGPRRDVLFVNEANRIEYETFDQLAIRTDDHIWADWNPVREFWFYTELLNKPDVDFITLTYLDNEALSPRIVKAIEAKKQDLRWWTVYGEGKLGEVEGRIYTGWREIKKIPHEARLIRYGLDFGFSTTPAAIVAIYQYNSGFIADECLYQLGLTNQQLADHFKNLPYALIKADCAEPKSIKELQMLGVPVFPVEKGADSVVHGIQFVQSKKVSLTERSVNLKFEYKNYMWMKDPNTNKFLDNEPDRTSPHDALDAFRYGMEGVTGESLSDDELSQALKQGKGKHYKWGR